MATMDLTTVLCHLLGPQIIDYNRRWMRQFFPMPVPIPPVIPTTISKGMNWIALFVYVRTVKSTGRV
jgi:hypothetical protein